MTGRGPALEGTLDDLPLPDLLRLLASTGKTGVLELRGAVPGLVVLHEGQLTLAVSESGPNLEQVCIGSGVASPDTWDEAQEKARRGVPLADAFTRMGVDVGRLRQVLYDQTVGGVFELRLPSGDAFGFMAEETHLLGHRFTFDVEEVLADTDRRVEAWRTIAEAVPSTAAIMRLCPLLAEPEVTITAEDWHVLAQVDGRVTIADIIRHLGMSAFAVCAVLHRLVDAGVVETVVEESNAQGEG